VQKADGTAARACYVLTTAKNNNLSGTDAKSGFGQQRMLN